jgi:hypothetical protein
MPNFLEPIVIIPNSIYQDNFLKATLYEFCCGDEGSYTETIGNMSILSNLEGGEGQGEMWDLRVSYPTTSLVDLS